MLEWIIGDQCTAGIIVIQEHKLLPEKFRSATSKLRKKYQVNGSPAAIKEKGPTGGVMILTRKDIQISYQLLWVGEVGKTQWFRGQFGPI